MSQQELKNKIVESINLSSNEFLLTEIYDMLNRDLLINDSGHFKLSNREKEALARGLKDFEEGRTLSDEEVRKSYAKYFK